MRIVHLVAGAGSMYCGSCLQGNTLVAALRQLGEDVLLAPLYTPLRTDEPSEASPRLAFGGINVYLQQKSALFRHTPGFVDRWLDRPAVLARLARLAGGTRPEGLAPLLMSMLEGRHGRQRKELDKLVDWLAREVRPELIHLSTAMLAGLAEELGRQLGTPVVCTLSGEDAFVEQMPDPQRSAARQLLGRRCRDLTCLVAMSHAYADHMAEYLSVPREQIRVIRPGLSLADFPADRSAASVREAGRPYTIGYLGRICAEKGLHVLLEAVGQLQGAVPVHTRLAGYLDPADRGYLEQLRSRAGELGVAGRFEYLGELDRRGKIEFLGSLDLFCAPSLRAESKALPVLEGWAAGVAAVLPDMGAFRELVADTGGGLLYEPANSASLAASITRLIVEPALAAECARRAHQAVHQRYTARRMAEQMRLLYREVLGGQGDEGMRRETMSSRERVLTALEHREPDRVPIDLGGNQTGIHKFAYEALLKHLGIAGQVDIMDAVQQLARPCQAVLERFHVDTRYIAAGPGSDYRGGIEKHHRDGRLWHDLTDEFGVVWSMPDDQPYYMDISHHPLAKATIGELGSYPFPKGNDPARFAGLREAAQRLRRDTPYAVVSGISGVVYEYCWYLRGLEQWFVDMLTEPEFCEALLDQTLRFWTDWFHGFLDEVGDLVDVIMIGDDLAGQKGPLFRPAFYRERVKPRQKALAQYIRSRTRAKIWYHTCGSCLEYIPDLIDNGVDILNPVQISAAGMDPTMLKARFGDRLTFWGGAIDSQHVLPRATPEEVRRQVGRNLEAWKPSGGYVFNNVHNIQAGVPPENIVALYDAAYEFGFY